MLKLHKNAVVTASLICGIMFAMPGTAMAYSCQAQFHRAEMLIERVEKLAKSDTDSRILAIIAQAKGIAHAGIISHNRASQGHTGDVGKFMHSDSVRNGKWAQQLAKQAYFLMTGEID